MLSENIALHRDMVSEALTLLGFTGKEMLFTQLLWNRSERAWRAGRDGFLARLDSFAAVSKRSACRAFKKLRGLEVLEEAPELGGRSSAAVIYRLNVQRLFDLSRQIGNHISSASPEPTVKDEAELNTER